MCGTVDIYVNLMHKRLNIMEQSKHKVIKLKTEYGKTWNLLNLMTQKILN